MAQRFQRCDRLVDDSGGTRRFKSPCAPECQRVRIGIAACLRNRCLRVRISPLAPRCFLIDCVGCTLSDRPNLQCVRATSADRRVTSESPITRELLRGLPFKTDQSPSVRSGSGRVLPYGARIPGECHRPSVTFSCLQRRATIRRAICCPGESFVAISISAGDLGSSRPMSSSASQIWVRKY